MGETREGGLLDGSLLKPDGHSPLYLAITALAQAQRHGECYCYRTGIVELLQLMVENGASLIDSQLEDDISQQLLNSRILEALATFDGKHDFIIDLFRAGA